MFLTFWLTYTDGCRANGMLRSLREMRRMVRRAAIQRVSILFRLRINILYSVTLLLQERKIIDYRLLIV